jgi:hypothetical protein
VYSWPSDAAILHFRPNDGSNARIGHKSSCESKRFTRLAWPSDGSICGQTMVQVTRRRNRRAERSGGLHETERSAVKEAWGYPSGGGRAQVGRSGRQAKRCPNMRAEGTEETTGLPLSNPYRRTVAWKPSWCETASAIDFRAARRRRIRLTVSADRSGSRIRWTRADSRNSGSRIREGAILRRDALASELPAGDPPHDEKAVRSGRNAICASSFATALPVTGPVCGGVRSEMGISRMRFPTRACTLQPFSLPHHGS